MLVLKYLQDGNILASPDNPDNYAAIFRLRWEILRKDWGLPLGSEQDDLEQTAIHRMISGPERNSPALACGRIHQVFDHTAQIRYMAVAAHKQGKGYGSEILKSLEDAAEELKIRQLYLHAREPAIEFYLRAGYTTEHETEPFLGIRHFRMSKLLVHQK